MAKVCVLGAGPAGCVFAARVAQLGHDVHLVERQPFPRRRLGESLTPGVAPLLKSANLFERIEASKFSRVREVWVSWGDGPRLRGDPREEGMLVDRGAFDQCLLEEARGLGVRIHQPARVVGRRPRGGGWRTVIAGGGTETLLDVDFLADASGREGAARWRVERAGAPTLAAYAYWRGAKLPSTPKIEAGGDVWYWGVPLPDGTYNTLAFVDPREFRGTPGSSLAERFLRLLARSSLMDGCVAAEQVGPALAVDATPYLDRECVTENAIRVGDSALAIDPISSSGVQKAVQNALAGAIVANTLLRRPSSGGIALQYYRARLAEISERHRHWASEHYGAVAAINDHPFWAARSAGLAPRPPAALPETFDASAMASSAVELSRDLQFLRAPCLEGDYVSEAEAIWRPGLESPLAFLAGRKLAPLLRRIAHGSTPLQIARAWTDEIPLQSGLAIAGWLVNHGVLVQQATQQSVRPE